MGVAPAQTASAETTAAAPRRSSKVPGHAVACRRTWAVTSKRGVRSQRGGTIGSRPGATRSRRREIRRVRRSRRSSRPSGVGRPVQDSHHRHGGHHSRVGPLECPHDRFEIGHALLEAQPVAPGVHRAMLARLRPAGTQQPGAGPSGAGGDQSHHDVEGLPDRGQLLGIDIGDLDREGVVERQSYLHHGQAVGIEVLPPPGSNSPRPARCREPPPRSLESVERLSSIHPPKLSVPLPAVTASIRFDRPPPMVTVRDRTARRQTHPRHRGAHRRLARLRGGRAGAEGGSGHRPDRRRARPVADPSGGPAPAGAPAGRARAGRDRPRTRRRGSRATSGPGGDRSTGSCTRSASPHRRVSGAGSLEAGWDDVKVAMEMSAYSLKLLAAGLPPPAAGGRWRLDRGARLRRHRGLARL